MESASHAIFEDWSPPILLTGTLILVAIIYLRGWFEIRKTRPSQFSQWRLLSFLLGIAVIWLAIASPLDGFADALLSAHMVEHPGVVPGLPTRAQLEARLTAVSA